MGEPARDLLDRLHEELRRLAEALGILSPAPVPVPVRPARPRPR